MLCKFYLFLLILFFVMARRHYGWGKHLTLPATMGVTGTEGKETAVTKLTLPRKPQQILEQSAHRTNFTRHHALLTTDWVFSLLLLA